MSYDFLLTIAIIMLCTKLFGLTSERVHMPQVVGALIAGVLVGPSVLGWVGRPTSWSRRPRSASSS